jgi:hypothetical protein
MSDLMKEFEAFEDTVDIDEDVNRSKDIDYEKYIEALNKYATDVLGLEGNSYVILKPVYLHGTKIHSLIFNVCRAGRRYSARLKRRVSLGIRDREGERWQKMLHKAYEIAINEPPVGLDPSLESLKYWKSSNRNCLRMTFAIDNSELVLNAKGIVSAHGKKEHLVKILHELNKRGL